MAEKVGLTKVIRTRRWLILALLCLLSPAVSATTQPASEESKQQMAEQHVNQLDKPLYSAFTERYILDEVKNLRQGIADVRVEMTTKIVDREIELADRALTYATDTVTYFFYLLAGASSLLVIIGWNSLRDVKERVGSYANEEIHRITASYEERLEALEKELSRKSKHIKAAQEEIELTNEIHSLWLKASQEGSLQNKIALYDQILSLRPDDLEALTYKADAALALGQAEWATSLANHALDIEPHNSLALYQRACAYSESGFTEEALRDLAFAIEKSESLRLQAEVDSSFNMLRDSEAFQKLIEHQGVQNA
ncbi:TPR end-of-group domain-containing protein [Bacterioplanoides sp.]|uniref:TPR end-of-group domain-containing protein n=1 Tax=Bacterioplanoides sp. TaxID=2066072 RepID=UPI003B5C60BD